MSIRRLFPDLLVINGDTILDVDYGTVVQHHRASGAAVTIVTTENETAPNYGVVLIDGDERILAFEEGNSVMALEIAAGQRRASNCGCYCFSVARSLGIFMESPNSSLERDIMPRLVKDLHTESFSNGHKLFLDFGIPERLQEAALLQRSLIEQIYYL